MPSSPVKGSKVVTIVYGTFGPGMYSGLRGPLEDGLDFITWGGQIPGQWHLSFCSFPILFSLVYRLKNTLNPSMHYIILK